MAKDLRAKMVLDISDLRTTLSQAEKETRKTVAAIERDSKVSISKMRLDLGSNVQEFMQSKRENMGIGGGPDARYNGMFGPTYRKASEYEGLNATRAMGLESTVKMAAQAAAAITVIDVATKVWNGDITEAADTIKKLPFGLGQVATSIESVIGSWTGMTAEIEANNAEAKKIEETSQRTNAKLRERIALEREIRDRIRENWEEATKASLSPYSAAEYGNAVQEREEIARARASLAGRMKDEPNRAAKWENAYQKEVASIQAKYLAIGRKAAQEENEKRLADGLKREEKYEREKAEIAKKAEEKSRGERENAERRGAAMVSISGRRAEEQITRQAQSRYDPFAGNSALVSQSLTRVPGTGNVATVEDKKGLQEAKESKRILQNIERHLSKNQLAAAQGI